MFELGELVSYKGDTGTVTFCCAQSMSFLVHASEEHRSKDVRCCVYCYDFDKVEKLSEQ